VTDVVGPRDAAGNHFRAGKSRRRAFLSLLVLLLEAFFPELIELFRQAPLLLLP
jgi:hypothetical protein